MTDWDAQDPELWPREPERLLLHAILDPEESARASWLQWLRDHAPSDLSLAESALLPPLYLAAERLRITGPIHDHLRSEYRRSWLANQLTLGHLLGLLTSLNEQELPSIVLKGVPLLLFYYCDIGARRMADVDLLVRQDDLPAVARTLESLGWTSAAKLPPADVIPYHHAIGWSLPSGFRLDLHWRAWTPDAPTAAEENVWRDSALRDYLGTELRVPSDTDLLVLTCYHGRKQDGFSKGRWVLDVAKIVETCGSDIDWTRVGDRATQCGLATPTGDALQHARSEYGVPIPELPSSFAPSETDDDSAMRYQELARHAAVGRGVAETLRSGWWRYAAVRRTRGEKATISAFISFYLADRKWQWGLETKWQVAVHAVRKALGRLRSRGI